MPLEGRAAERKNWRAALLLTQPSSTARGVQSGDCAHHLAASGVGQSLAAVVAIHALSNNRGGGATAGRALEQPACTIWIELGADLGTKCSGRNLEAGVLQQEIGRAGNNFWGTVRRDPETRTMPGDPRSIIVLVANHRHPKDRHARTKGAHHCSVATVGDAECRLP